MAQAQELREFLRQRFRLEQKLLDTEQRLEQLRQALPEGKAAKRETAAALLEYESGGLKMLLDKLSGKWQEKQEALSRAAREAANALERTQWELTGAERQAEALRRELEALGSPEERYGAVLAEYPHLREQLQRQKAYLLAKRLIPLLEENDRALKTAQQLARGNVLGELSMEEHNKDIWFARADGLAKECGILLHGIADCGMLPEVHPYFENPAGYIMSVTQNSRLDRIHHALDALWEAKHQIRELILQLTEEE